MYLQCNCLPFTSKLRFASDGLFNLKSLLRLLFILNPGRWEETVNGYFHKNANSLLELEGPGDKLWQFMNKNIIRSDSFASVNRGLVHVWKKQ